MAALGVSAADAGNVSASPDVAAFESPINLAPAAPATFDADHGTADQIIAPTSESAASSTIVNGHAGHGEVLLLLGDYRAPESEAWTSSFEAGSMSAVAPPPLGGSLDPVLAPMPDQVLVPLPPAAWTGFAGLVGLGLFGVMKRARRFLQ
jgi:hypothetical protein